MWESTRLPVQDLEKRLTEFQVVESASRGVVGGIGFQIAGRHGRLHSEVYSDFSLADSARPLLWERIQTLASNHGIVRLWTREDAPFWKQRGLEPASHEALRKLPAAWADADEWWLTLALKSEEAILSVDKEFATMMATEKERTARALQHARLIKYVATGLAIVFALFVAVAVFYMLRNNPELLHPRR